jgi:transcriptional regulator with XRE-family HTH domain
MKTAERERARKLRREEGRSVKELAALLGVSRSSISLWVRDIELTPDQYAALRRRMGVSTDHERTPFVLASVIARLRRTGG